MEQSSVSLKISPKLKYVLTDMYGLRNVGGDSICAELNGWFNIAQERSVDDRENVFTLVHKCLDELQSHGYSDEVLHRYILHGFSPILFYCTTHNAPKFTPGNMDKFSEDMRKFCKSGKFGIAMLKDLLDSINILCEYHRSGIVPILVPPIEKKVLCEQLEALIELYKSKIGEYHTVSVTAISNRIYSIRVFLSSMEHHGVKNVEAFSHKSVNESITELSRNYNGGIGSFLFVIRSFLTFLFEAEITPVDYSAAMPQRIPKRRKMRFGFTAEEISSVLGSVNLGTRIGKRDYTIMLIAARTGLRACDIGALKLKDIDWHNFEIHIIQQKTKVALTLPLTAEVGNAIVNYFYNARHKTDSPYLFPLQGSSDQHIKSPTISALTTKYMCIAGIDESLPYRGVHSFRRSFGK
jgi:integrase